MQKQMEDEAAHPELAKLANMTRGMPEGSDTNKLTPEGIAFYRERLHVFSFALHNVYQELLKMRDYCISPHNFDMFQQKAGDYLQVWLEQHMPVQPTNPAAKDRIEDTMVDACRDGFPTFIPLLFNLGVRKRNYLILQTVMGVYLGTGYAHARKRSLGPNEISHLTPLHVKTIQILLDAGIDPNGEIMGIGGMSPLQAATTYTTPEFVEQLLCAGADPHSKGEFIASSIQILNAKRAVKKDRSEKNIQQLQRCQELFDTYDNYKALLELRSTKYLDAAGIN